MSDTLTKVLVASRNPVKKGSAEDAFKLMFPHEDIQVEGADIPSGVSDQPMTDGETFQGAYNRAHTARVDFPSADYWVGMEGGVEELQSYMYCFAWIVILDRERMGVGKSVMFPLPQEIQQLMQSGMEMGEASDKVFKRENIKQNEGTVGALTNNVITRKQYYIDPTVFALIPFRNPDLYSV